MSLLKLLWSFVRYPAVWLEILYWYCEESEGEEQEIPYVDDLKSTSKRTMWSEPKKN